MSSTPVLTFNPFHPRQRIIEKDARMDCHMNSYGKSLPRKGSIIASWRKVSEHLHAFLRFAFEPHCSPFIITFTAASKVDGYAVYLRRFILPSDPARMSSEHFTLCTSKVQCTGNLIIEGMGASVTHIDWGGEDWITM